MFKYQKYMQIKDFSFFKEIVEQSPNAILITDIYGNIQYTNKRFTELSGYHFEEICNQNPRILNARTQPQEYYAKMWQTITQGKAWEGEFHNKKKNGEFYWEKVKITPIKNELGEITNFCGIKEDITKQKELAGKLKESEKKYGDIIKTVSDWIWEIDNTGKYTFSSPQINTILGYTEQEIIGKFPYDFMPKDEMERIYEHFMSIIKEGKTMNKLESVHVHKNGEKIMFETSGMPFFDSNGKILGYRGIDRDITEKKELEIKLRESNNTKDKFFSIIAHDLKSSFNAMLGFSELLVSDFDKYGIEQQKRFMNILHTSIKNTFKLLENLLVWAQSQTRAIDFHPESENLYLIITEILDLMEPLAEKKSINLKNEILPDIFIYADKYMLSTILRNLISNAIKFTPKHGLVNIKANKTLINDKHYIKISIEDNGVGISEEVQTQLFNICKNISTKGTENEEGSGLGLVLCKGFVEKHEGKIWVESKLGKGSTFMVTIPVI